MNSLGLEKKVLQKVLSTSLLLRVLQKAGVW